MKDILMQLRIAIKEVKGNFGIIKKDKFLQARLEANIVRYVHSIEKGLSISNPRLGFGIEKVKRILSLSEEYIENKYEHTECIYFARDALQSYFEWNDENNFTNDEISTVREKYKSIFSGIGQCEEKMGGIEEIKSDDFDFDIKQIENLFNTRHSIREFTGKEVPEADIIKAVKLAQRSPSACNRQAVRVYSVNGRKYMSEIGQSLEGIGGFADDVDKFLLITAKQSAYGLFEKNQYIVSAAMFAGYLTLALHTYNIASCTIQRSLLPDNKQWDLFREKNSIPEDEQIVVMIGVGMYKERTKVPVSKRYAIDYIYRNLDVKE